MSTNYSPQALHDFIVKAKAASYVGDGQPAASSRPKSHDLAFSDGDFSYLDSYYGGWDFIGEEVVYHQGEAVWAMNYYGKVTQPDKISAAEAGQTIKASLSKMYAEGRFLGGFGYTHGDFHYTDTSEGEFTSFTGKEWITRGGEVVYELVYHGGLVK
ncbi:MAG: DUF5680 domain-containing protein [Anaerolineae bacterium]|jgi:hypothetical protein|nr:DUF5680 domain-containing protein [Anaerolineae bacterium]